MNQPTQTWPADRLAELEQLTALLNRLQAINHTRGFIERTAEAIRWSEELTRQNMTAGRASFLLFLRTQAGVATGGER